MAPGGGERADMNAPESMEEVITMAASEGRARGWGEGVAK